MGTAERLAPTTAGRNPPSMTDTNHVSGLVTVVFVDIEGSTALVDRLGDEAGTATLRTQLDAVRERIEPYGGREVKSLGDGLMLAFSSPRLAVGFALASQRAMAGTTPRVRIGINTGEVLAAAGDPVGGAVNAAARIADPLTAVRCWFQRWYANWSARRRPSASSTGAVAGSRASPAAIVYGLLDCIAESGPAQHRVAELLATRADTREGVDLGYAVIEATVDLIEPEAGAGPVLIAVEDLHWADDLSLRVVAALARRAGPSPISVIASCRPVPRPPLLDRIVEHVTAQDGRHLRLASLDEIDVLALTSAQTGAAAAPALRARLATTAGDPLYITELLRSLDEDGLLRIEAGVVDVTGEGLPADLRTTLIRRLSWLSADVVEFLRLASLLGGTFTLRDLASVTGRSIVDVAALLQEASQSGLVIGDGDRLTFRHDLIREAIYTDMAPAVRGDLHRAAGQALAAEGAPVTQIAQQFALGARPGDLDAVAWLERAGNEVLAVSPSSAITLFEQALELAPITWPGRAALQVRLIEPSRDAAGSATPRARCRRLRPRHRAHDQPHRARLSRSPARARSRHLIAERSPGQGPPHQSISRAGRPRCWGPARFEPVVGKAPFVSCPGVPLRRGRGRRYQRSHAGCTCRAAAGWRSPSPR